MYWIFVHSTTKNSSTLYDVASRKTSEPSNGRRNTSARTAKRDDAEHLKQLVTEAVAAHVTEKVSEKLTIAAERQADKLAQKAARHVERLDRLASHLDTLDVWTRSEPGTRRPRFSRDEIATVAIRIADAEGFDAVSMRRIAADLDAGTMTLYHYVRTKDELLALVMDAVMGEVLVPDGHMPTEWREAITVIARRSRDALLRHPWVLDIADDPKLGPNSVKHFDQSLQALNSLALPLRDKLDVITTVDEFVFGYCLLLRSNPTHDDRASDDMRAYVKELIETGGYPQLQAMADEHGLDRAWELIDAHSHDRRRFERNLARIIDGIGAALDQRGRG